MGSTFDDFNQIRRMVKTGASVIGSLEAEEHRKNQERIRRGESQVNSDSSRMNAEEASYQRGVRDASKNGSDRYELKEMSCPNCGAMMKPDELANTEAVLGSVDCPYCGTKIVLNDDVKNAEYVHKVDVEKKRAEIEERKVKLQEDKQKYEQMHETTKDTLDTIKSVDQGIDRAMKFGKIAIGCFSVIFILFILMIVFIIWVIGRF